MKQLPKSFAILCKDPKDPLRQKYIKWYNETFNCKVAGNYIKFYYWCIVHNWETLPDWENNILKFNNNTVELKLEEWDSIVNWNEKEEEVDFEKEINNKIKLLNWKTDNISDWYHTFWELYKHRIHLFIALCKSIYLENLYSDKTRGISIIKSKLHSDWSEFEWWFIIQLETRFWQISYHLPNEYWDKCNFIETKDKANEWDWHTSDDVLERLLQI